MAETSSTDFIRNQKNVAREGLINPKGILKKDDFLKLLMTQLKYQDPTSPMDTDKMLSQTADMAVIEAQANMQSELEKMIKQFRSSTGYQAIGAVGKLADTGMNGIEFKERGEPYKDLFHFYEAFDNGVLSVINKEGAKVRTMAIDRGERGLQEIAWDGNDDNGDAVPAGIYTIKIDYTGATSGKAYTSELGTYPIDSVVLNGEAPQIFAGGRYYKLDEIAGIKDMP